MASVEYDHALDLHDSDVFKQLDDYPWESDNEFQSGLRAILGPDPDPSRAQHLTLRARCFYYARKFNTPVDFSAYQTWLSRQATETTLSSDVHNTSEIAIDTFVMPQVTERSTGILPQTGFEISDVASPSAPMPGNPPPGPYPISFSHIVDLITTGQPVPGVKDIPDTVLAGHETHTVAATRKKPWERGES